MASGPALQDTCTLAEGVLSKLIGLNLIDETNPMYLRTFAKKAKEELDIPELKFYTDIYVYEDAPHEGVANYAGDFELLDELVEELTGDL